MTTVYAAIGAAFIAGLSALLGARIGATSQHKAWLRAQRLESATEVLCEADRLLSRLIDTPEQQARDELRVQGTNDLIDLPARSRLILVGNRRTEAAVRGLISQLGEPETPTDESPKYRSARSKFIAHVHRLIHG